MDLRIFTILAYASGLICAPFAIWRSRTPQGATAWVVGLVGFPFLMVPLYLIFGRSKFYGYAKARRELDRRAQEEIEEADQLKQKQVEPPTAFKALNAAAEMASQVGFTEGNRIQLLIDGEETYARLFEELTRARKYILFQFYIFRADKIGQEFADLLMRKASEGVKVYFLYDSIGTGLKSSFVRKLKAGGVQVAAFRSSKNWSTRFQVNFRNHRKLVVVDGQTAFVGGLNIGDDYLGLWPKVGPWRDTHVCLQGPSAAAAQVSFAKDWYWASEEIPDLDWNVKAQGDDAVCVLHTGPADQGETCLMALQALLHAAKQRIWIANPYVVPPEGLANALSLAALRGVDVRVIIPSTNDNRWVAMASEAFADKVCLGGVKFYKYSPGFMHQKVILIDDQMAVVGSTNLDSRSIFINFEIQAISGAPHFVNAVVKMLEEDFARAQAVPNRSFEKLPIWRQLLAKAVSLMSPVL